jgi:Family of unknown function (DUF6459)
MRRAPHHRPVLTQGALALSFSLPSGLPVIPEVPPRLALVDDDFGPVRTPTRSLPPVTAWSARLATAIAEVLDGQRPASQLIRWVSSDVDAGLRAWARAKALHPSLAAVTWGPDRLPSGRRRARRVRSLRWTSPSDGVAEIAAVIEGDPRPLVVALRLEGLDGRWVCVHAGTPDGWSVGGS